MAGKRLYRKIRRAMKRKADPQPDSLGCKQLKAGVNHNDGHDDEPELRRQKESSDGNHSYDEKQDSIKLHLPFSAAAAGSFSFTYIPKIF